MKTRLMNSTYKPKAVYDSTGRTIVGVSYKTDHLKPKSSSSTASLASVAAPAVTTVEPSYVETKTRETTAADGAPIVFQTNNYYYTTSIDNSSSSTTTQPEVIVQPPAVTITIPDTVVAQLRAPENLPDWLYTKPKTPSLQETAHCGTINRNYMVDVMRVLLEALYGEGTIESHRPQNLQKES